MKRGGFDKAAFVICSKRKGIAFKAMKDPGIRFNLHHERCDTKDRDSFLILADAHLFVPCPYDCSHLVVLLFSPSAEIRFLAPVF